MSALPQAVPGRIAPLETDASELYERHRRRLLGFCTSQMGSREEAEDAVQDTFIYAIRALQRGVVPECELAWLFTIARNVCHSRRRNGRRRGRVVVTRDLDALQDVIPAREAQRDELLGLPEALGAIPAAQRQAILLREWQGLTYREIGERLELSQSAVEALLFRARRSLARALDQTGKVAARALNLPPAISLVRSLLEGSAVKLGAGALAVAAAAGAGAASVHMTTHATRPAAAAPVSPIASTPDLSPARHAAAPPVTRLRRPARPRRAAVTTHPRTNPEVAAPASAGRIPAAPAEVPAAPAAAAAPPADKVPAAPAAAAAPPADNAPPPPVRSAPSVAAASPPPAPAPAVGVPVPALTVPAVPPVELPAPQLPQPAPDVPAVSVPSPPVAAAQAPPLP